MLDRLQKWTNRTIGLLLATSFKALAHCGIAPSLSIFFRYLVDVHLNWLNGFHFFILEGELLFVIDCMIFLLSLLDATRIVYHNSFFLCTARLWKSLPIECFSLICDRNRFKSRINRHLLSLGYF